MSQNKSKIEKSADTVIFEYYFTPSDQNMGQKASSQTDSKWLYDSGEDEGDNHPELTKTFKQYLKNNSCTFLDCLVGDNPTDSRYRITYKQWTIAFAKLLEKNKDIDETYRKEQQKLRDKEYAWWFGDKRCLFLLNETDHKETFMNIREAVVRQLWVNMLNLEPVVIGPVDGQQPDDRIIVFPTESDEPCVYREAIISYAKLKDYVSVTEGGTKVAERLAVGLPHNQSVEIMRKLLTKHIKRGGNRELIDEYSNVLKNKGFLSPKQLIEVIPGSKGSIYDNEIQSKLKIVPGNTELPEKDVFYITEYDFKDAYSQVVGINVFKDSKVGICANSNAYSGFNDSIAGVSVSDLFKTMIRDPQIAQSRQYDYQLEFARNQNLISGKSWNMVTFVFFLVAVMYTFQADRDIGRSFYANLSIFEGIANDEVQNDAEPRWFPQTYFDTANTEDYWVWFDSKIVNTFWGEENETTGIDVTYSTSQQLLGSVKVRQVRQASEKCKGLGEMMLNSRDSCNNPGDTRASTNFLPWQGVRNPPTSAEVDLQQSVDGSIAARRCGALGKFRAQSPGLDKARTITIGYYSDDGQTGRILSLIFRILAEERMYSSPVEDRIFAKWERVDPNNIRAYDVIINLKDDDLKELKRQQPDIDYESRELYSGTRSSWYITDNTCSDCDSLRDLDIKENWDSVVAEYPFNIRSEYGRHYMFMTSNPPPDEDVYRRTFMNHPKDMSSEESMFSTLDSFRINKWGAVYYASFPSRIVAATRGRELVGSGSSVTSKRYIATKLTKDSKLLADVYQLYKSIYFRDSAINEITKFHADNDFYFGMLSFQNLFSSVSIFLK